MYVYCRHRGLKQLSICQDFDWFRQKTHIILYKLARKESLIKKQSMEFGAGDNKTFCVCCQNIRYYNYLQLCFFFFFLSVLFRQLWNVSLSCSVTVLTKQEYDWHIFPLTGRDHLYHHLLLKGTLVFKVSSGGPDLHYHLLVV